MQTRSQQQFRFINFLFFPLYPGHFFSTKFIFGTTFEIFFLETRDGIYYSPNFNFMKKINVPFKLCRIATGTLIAFSMTLASCSKDDSTNSGGSGGTANTTMKITDAPIDDANVSGAFVTIADIKLDGQSVSGFTKTTINLAAYQNGATQTIGNFNLAAKTYSTVTFVLDFDMDASGSAPGSYILTTGGIKHKLQSSSNIITVNKSLSLVASGTNTVVADFDLRKMIVHQSGGPTDHYDLATAAELQNDVRVTVDNGTISGTLTDAVSGSAKVVAYVYKKGTFNRATELSGQGASNVQFSNALSSTLVGGGGSYQFHFLESGTYEVYFASYKDTNADGEFELQGTLIATAAGGLDLLNLSLSANATLTVNVIATGVLP